MTDTAPQPAVKLPKDWDKWVSAAYLRLIGATQGETARGVGRSQKTIWSWEQQRVLWSAAKEEARGRWLNDLRDEASATVFKAIKGGNAAVALTVLERLEPKLAPAKQKHVLTGPDDGPIEITAVRETIARVMSNPDLHAAAAKMGQAIGDVRKDLPSHDPPPA